MNTPSGLGLRRPRRIRSVPLVFGVLFVALGYGGIIASADVDDASLWLWPAALLAVGGAGVFATIRTALVRRATRHDLVAEVAGVNERVLTHGADDDTDVIGETPAGSDPEDDADEPGTHGA